MVEDKQCKRWNSEPNFQQEINGCVLFAVINAACRFGRPRKLPEKEIFAILKKGYHLRERVVEKALSALMEQGLVRSEQGKIGKKYFPEFTKPEGNNQPHS